MICAYVIINFIGRGEVLFKWYHHLIIVCSVLFNINYDVFLILVDEFDIRVLNYQTWGDSFAIIGFKPLCVSTNSPTLTSDIFFNPP